MQRVEATAERGIAPEAELPYAADAAIAPDRRARVAEARRARIGDGRRVRVAETAPRSTTPPSSARRGLALMRASRPGRWLKNALVLLAPASAGAFTRPGAATSAWVAAIAFCLLSSAVALIQGTTGGARRARAGELPRAQTLRFGTALAVVGLLCATVATLALGVLALLYLLAALTLPTWSRQVPLAAVVAMAGGLVARAVAGDLAAGAPIHISFLLLVCACALVVGVVRHRAAHGRSAAPVGSTRARARRVLTIALGVLLCDVFVSFVAAMNAPSNTPLGVRAVEWLRGNGAAWLVSDVENVYYSLNAPATGGPALKKLPEVGSAHVRSAGYRPPPIPAVIHPALPGEGKWHGTGPLVHGSAPVLVTTFRPDPNYPQMVAGVARIDTSLSRLELYPGRYEPPNAGHPPAQVPPRQRRALLATFNSGFRLEDDSGGFVAGGRVYSPLKDGQATIIGHRSGKVDITTWHGGPQPGRDVEFARQNLPLIVEGGRLNPSLNDGALWGATVGNAVRVWRSGVGIDAHGNLIYAAADIQTAQSLAQILKRAGAVRAMELDINYDWTTLNFYGTWDAGKPHKLLPDMSRPSTRYLTPDDRDFFAVYARSTR